MEAIDEEIRKLQEELKDADPNSQVVQGHAEEAGGARRTAIGKEADEIEKNANEDLPFDLDAQPAGEAEGARRRRAGGRRGVQKETDRSTASCRSPVAGEKLNELREKLGTKREEFKEEATEPLEHLAKIFPLKEDEARFADLYLRQRDLAERMAALKAKAGDDPGSKARMRDLENEQRQLREELRDLLDDIDSHVAALPEDRRELDDLRKTATEFAEAVRASARGRGDAVVGDRAVGVHRPRRRPQWSKQAADTLEKFLGKCKADGRARPAVPEVPAQAVAGAGQHGRPTARAQGLGMKPGMGHGRRRRVQRPAQHADQRRPLRQPARA